MQAYETEASPLWKQSYFEERLAEWKGEIKALVRGRTSAISQIVVNLIAWLITILLSLAIYFAVRTQTVDELVRERVDQIVASHDSGTRRDDATK